MAEQAVLAVPRQPWVGPVLIGAAAAAGCVGLALVDPSDATAPYPRCLFLMVTGLPCPGCGSLRALHVLLRGDLVGALGYNVLTVLAMPVLVYAWVAWLLPALRIASPPRVSFSPRSSWALLGAFILFGVVRNLPGLEVLAP